MPIFSKIHSILITTAVVFFTLALFVSQSFAIEGTKTIKLQDNKGEEVVVGTIDFQEDDGKTSYKIEWNDGAFEDFFLSMRPFKCIPGASKHWCRVPYPYPNNRVISGEDMADLEYDLLFIWKGSSEYGINTWNGVYYDLKLMDDKIIGVMNEMDMNIISAPPDEGNLRPIGEADLTLAEPEGHWLPKLIIE